MYRSAYQMSVAATQIRNAAATMNNIVSDMREANVWSGADADRFAQDWTDQVMTPLYRAATNLDAVTFKTVGE